MIIYQYFKHVCYSLDHTLNNFSEILFECKTEISKISKFSFDTRKQSRRMRTAWLPTVCASMVTRSQYHDTWGGDG